MRLVPAVMRWLAAIATITYGIYETALWHSGGPASLRGLLLTVMAVTVTLGWVPLLTEARIRTVLREEHEQLLVSMDDRERARDEVKRSRHRKEEADAMLRERMSETPSGKLALRRIGI